jgi:ubiquinone/menaquinone biosynthesis C-methylase UbiE
MRDHWHAIHEYALLMGSYDLIAPLYDPLSRLVFGKAQLRAQRDLLHFIRPNDRILIVGGGTGWILDDITRLPDTPASITFVESSAKMVDLARKRNTEHVHFLNLPIEEFHTNEKYDVILTGFLFDNFRERQALTVFEQLDGCLNPGGTWLFVEFQSRQWWQKSLLALMYAFFHLVSRLEVSKLVDMEPFFNRRGYEVRQSKTYFKGLILSIAYKRPT